jgi:hypothetical protein
VVGRPYTAGLDPFTAAGLDRTLRAYRMRRWTRTGSCKRRENVLISWRRQKVEHASEAFFDAYCGPSEPGSTGLLMLVTRLVDRDLPSPSVAPPPVEATTGRSPSPPSPSWLLRVPVVEDFGDWLLSVTGLTPWRADKGTAQLVGVFQTAFAALGAAVLCVLFVPVVVAWRRGARTGLAVGLWAVLLVVLFWQGLLLTMRLRSVEYPAMGISRGFLYIALPATVPLFLFYLGRTLRRRWRAEHES